jgi:hypothetical protein
MDAITLILNALTAGAAASVQSTTSEAVKDLYTGLKSLIQSKLAKKQHAELILAEHEKDPETWEAPLKKVLIEGNVAEEQDILEAARSLMVQINPQQATISKYSITFNGAVEGNAIGDHQQITMYFGRTPDEKEQSIE